MPRAKKEAGSLTGSQRVKNQKSSKAGAKARQAAKKAFDLVGDTAKSVTQGGSSNSNVAHQSSSLSNSLGGLSATNSSLSHKSPEALKDSPLYNFQAQGFNEGFTPVQQISDPYMGLKVPEFDRSGATPQDLLRPDGIETISEEELNQALTTYAGGTNAQRAKQAGYNYIGEVGKTLQAEQKAKQNIIKGGKEAIKTQQELVKFDTERINLNTTIEGRNQANQRLMQAQIRVLTLGASR